MPEIPQLTLPLRIVGDEIEQVEQGSDADISGQAIALVLTPPGWLQLDGEDAKGFGLSNQAHREGGADVSEIERQIDTYVADAQALVLEQPDALNDALSRIGVRVGGS